jgi:hypothetical protein
MNKLLDGIIQGRKSNNFCNNCLNLADIVTVTKHIPKYVAGNHFELIERMNVINLFNILNGLVPELQEIAVRVSAVQ